MDSATARMLNSMTSSFYREQAASFSNTRQRPWDGWQVLADTLRQHWGGDDQPRMRSVLDLACSNLRFERFLLAEFPQVQLTFHTADNCDQLLQTADGLQTRHVAIDIVSSLLDDASPATADRMLASIPPCDLSVSFGFLHHVPTADARNRALDLLLQRTRRGGLAAVSLWRFADDPQALAKAQESTECAVRELAATAGAPAQLDPGDYILGWQETPGAWRYCHSFDDADVQTLVDHVAQRACLVDCFRADGRTGESNHYLVFQAL